MRRFSLVSLVAVAFAALVVAAPASAGTLDQQQEDDSDFETFEPARALAQTFTAGITGQLDQVDLSLDKLSHNCGADPLGLIVEIRTVDSEGTPTATVLATATIAPSAVPEAIATSPAAMTPALFPSPASVIAGTQYAIFVRSDASSPGSPGSCYAWYGSFTNPYAGGAAFERGGSSGFTALPDSDFAFRTYVIPTPPTGAIVCKGEPVTIPGTEGNDELTGTPGRDVIAALGGKDKVFGLAGKDLICGGSGRDSLRGGKNKDKLFGQAGKDTLRGQGGKDRLFGKGGKDRLNGGNGKDVCKGGKKDDTAKKCEVEKSI